MDLCASDLPSWRMWLDSKTAVILKMQSFDKGGGDTMRSEAVVDRVSFDDVFANSLFGIPSSLPQFSDINGQPSESAETGADVPSGRDALGELYFFELPHQSNQPARLVRMPGLCAVVMAVSGWKRSHRHLNGSSPCRRSCGRRMEILPQWLTLMTRMALPINYGRSTPPRIHGHRYGSTLIDSPMRARRMASGSHFVSRMAWAVRM